MRDFAGIAGNAQAAVAAQGEALLFRSRLGTRRGRGGFDPALGSDAQRGGIGGADDDDGADRSGNRILRRAGQRKDNRRLAGIGGRIDPGVDAGRRAIGGPPAPIEGGGDAGVFFRPREQARGAQSEHGQRAQRVTIDGPEAGRGNDRPKLCCKTLGAELMQPPEALRPRIAAIGERIRQRGGGRVGIAGVQRIAGLTGAGPAKKCAAGSKPRPGRR